MAALAYFKLIAGFAAGLLFAAGLYFLVQPGQPLQTLGPGCVGCHLRTSLKFDGPAAAALSKGTHPVRVRAEDPAILRSAECSGCHKKVHASWRASAHGRAFTNPIFRHAFERDRKAWCLNCHAPLWEPGADGPARAAEIASTPDDLALYAEGVNCATCHIRDGGIVGKTDYPPGAELFHPVRYDPGLRRETFCAGCHQFNFVHTLEPVALYEGDEHPMQNVHRELSDLGRADLSCVGCHYANGAHNLKSGEIERLRDKIKVVLNSSEAAGGYRTRLGLTMNGLGHHFPTGDLFRVLSFYIHDRSGAELFRYDFRKEVRVIDYALIADTTLKPAPGSTTATATVETTTRVRPARCLLVYRLQGAIEPEIAKDFEPGILREIVYDGPCAR